MGVSRIHDLFVGEFQSFWVAVYDIYLMVLEASLASALYEYLLQKVAFGADRVLAQEWNPHPSSGSELVKEVRVDSYLSGVLRVRKIAYELLLIFNFVELAAYVNYIVLKLCVTNLGQTFSAVQGGKSDFILSPK